MCAKSDANLSGAESLADRLSTTSRYLVLFSAFAGLVFAGAGLGLMPSASRSITVHFLDVAYSEQAAGVWLAYYTASMMFGAGQVVIGFGAHNRSGDDPVSVHCIFTRTD
jgi:hypothetical protein